MNIENFKELEIKLDYSDIIEEASKELSENIKQASLQNFKGTGAYGNSWTYRLEGKGNKKIGVVHNKEHYRLTHLLEFGHVIANTSRRVAPRPHIKPQFEKYIPIYVEKMAKCKIDIKEK